MARERFDPLAPDPAGLAAAVAVLRRGGVVAYPTDTLYGLAVDPRNDEAVERLFAVKGRGAASAIALIAADATMAEQVAAEGFGPLERRLASAFWPGPLTMVVPAARGMAAALTPHGTLGVRVPAHLVARSLSAAFGACITATSANLDGPATVGDGRRSRRCARRSSSTFLSMPDQRPAARRRPSSSSSRAVRCCIAPAPWRGTAC